MRCVRIVDAFETSIEFMLVTKCTLHVYECPPKSMTPCVLKERRIANDELLKFIASSFSRSLFLIRYRWLIFRRSGGPSHSGPHTIKTTPFLKRILHDIPLFPSCDTLLESEPTTQPFLVLIIVKAVENAAWGAHAINDMNRQEIKVLVETCVMRM